MDKEFTDIIQRMARERGKEILVNGKAKTFLSDYCAGQFKKEADVFLRILNANCGELINDADNVPERKQKLTARLEEDYSLSPNATAEYLDLLGLILKGDASKTRPNAQTPPPAAASNPARLKENSPKIPQRFTDEFIKGEIAKLEKEIANCDAEIAKAEKDASAAQSNVQFYINENLKLGDWYRSIAPDGDYNLAWERTQNDGRYLTNNEWQKKENDRANCARQRAEEYKIKKALYEAKKRKIEPIANIPCLDRVENYYNRFVEAMKKESTEDEYKNFAKEFRSLEGYKDSAELADKCDKLAEKQRNVREAKAKTEQEAREAKAKAEQKARIPKYQRCVAACSYRTACLKSDGTVVEVGKKIPGHSAGSWRDIIAVAAGGSFIKPTVGIKTDGTVIVIGTGSDKYDVSSWRDIAVVAVGGWHIVGLKADGTVVAVGSDEKSQCNVSGWRDITAVAAGGGHTVGLKADGTVVAVGSDEKGQCNVSAWRDITAVAAGSDHTVGLKADGTVVAVGENEKEQCNVSAWRDIAAVAAGEDHTVGLKSDGTVVAVGSNEEGKCNVNGWRDIAAVAAGVYHTVGLKADGTVVAVGSNNQGQCNVNDLRDIGPFSEEKALPLRQKDQAEREARKAEQEAREAERRRQQQQQWQEQGLCKYCGGKLGGLFTKKCKDCGKEQ
jgi:hypothetical protein